MSWPRQSTVVFLGCVSFICLSGCVIIRPSAATIISLQHPADAAKIDLGFRDTSWAFVDSKPVIVSHGWHPREHETYAFFINEGYPAFRPRWLMISLISTEIPEQCKLSLLLLMEYSQDGWKYFEGVIPKVDFKSSRKVRVHLRDVKLRSADGTSSILLSGDIVAEPASEEHVKGMIETRRSYMEKHAPETARTGNGNH